MAAGSFVLALVGLSACGGGDQQQAGQAPPVTVDRPQMRDIREYGIFTGSTRAIESAEIVARVAGRLETVEYAASSMVRKGDLLFTIEREKYRALRDAAYAGLQSARADLARAETELVRVEKASESRAVSEMDVDRAVAERDMAQATVLAADASLAEAELNLSYTRVVATIGGMVSRRQVDPGNLVGQDGPTLLTTINRMNPIYVYFNLPESHVLDFLAARKSRPTPEEAKKKNFSVHISLANEEDFPHQGYVDYLDNTVDPATGTIEVRAVFDNEKSLLFPGLFVRVKVPGPEMTPDAVIIPETALGTDLGGKYVYVIGENDIVEQRYVELGMTQDDGTVHVRSGLKGDETVIVNGIMFARPGLPVTPLTAEQFAAMRAQQAQGQ